MANTVLVRSAGGHLRPAQDPLRTKRGLLKANRAPEACTLGWSEITFLEDNVSKVALRYQNTAYEILARSERCKDPPKIVEVLEML